MPMSAVVTAARSTWRACPAHLARVKRGLLRHLVNGHQRSSRRQAQAGFSYYWGRQQHPSCARGLRPRRSFDECTARGRGKGTPAPARGWPPGGGGLQVARHVRVVPIVRGTGDPVGVVSAPGVVAKGVAPLHEREVFAANAEKQRVVVREADALGRRRVTAIALGWRRSQGGRPAP
eukprot:scaffold184669_cov26-Tisochrysis_lutea.AAC.5